MESDVEKKKKKVKNWLKDKQNLLFLLVLVFSFILLMYYFNLTKSQTLWWDEAEYMSMAKHWARNTFEYSNPQRPILFPFLAFLLYSIGLKDIAIKFILVLLPAWLVVFFTFFLVKEMYNKKVALIAAFITSVSWIHIFYAMRFMTDALSLLFGILALFYFWKGYINKKGNKYIWLTGLFIALSTLSRLTGILYGVIILIFLLLTDKFSFLKNKHIWGILLMFILIFSPYLLWNYNAFGNALAFRKGYGGPGSSELGWWMLTLVYDYPEFIFFVFFLLGLLTIAPMFLSLDLMILKREKKYSTDFFLLLSIIITLAFFIYFLRTGENRWLILMSIGIFTFASKGVLLVYDLMKKNIGKIIAITILLIILVSGAYYQIKHTDSIIKAKLDSYKPIENAALWMKENSAGEPVLSVSYTQTIFYYEGPVYTYSNMNQSQFDELVQKVKPKYLLVSSLEPGHPDWIFSLPEKYQQILQPVNAWFADQQQKQPILIIYEFIY